MARQTGPFPVSGKIGDRIYYITKTGAFSRAYGKPDQQALKRHPAAARLRAEKALFGAASGAAMLLRYAFEPHTEGLKTERLHNRLTGVLKKSIAAAAGYNPAAPVCSPEVIRALGTFSWHPVRKVPAALYDACSPVVTGTPGSAFALIINSLDPVLLLPRPAGATHFRVQAVLAAITFGWGRYKTVAGESGLLAYQDGPTGDFMLEGRLRYTPAGSIPVLGIGITAYEVAGGKPRALQGGSSFGLLPGNYTGLVG